MRISSSAAKKMLHFFSAGHTCIACPNTYPCKCCNSWKGSTVVQQTRLGYWFFYNYRMSLDIWWCGQYNAHWKCMHSVPLCLANKAILSWMQGISTACLDAQYSDPSVATNQWVLFFCFQNHISTFHRLSLIGWAASWSQQCDHRYAIWHLTSVVVCQNDRQESSFRLCTKT